MSDKSPMLELEGFAYTSHERFERQIETEDYSIVEWRIRLYTGRLASAITQEAKEVLEYRLSRCLARRMEK